MKKEFIFLLGLFCSLTAFSQNENYNSFVEEGKVWNMLCSNKEPLGMYPDYDWRYFIKGDTTISDLCCKKLYVYNENNNGQPVFNLSDFRNNATGIIGTYKSQLFESPNTIYDLQGRKLKQVPQKGLYIQNGKKFKVEK